LQEACGLPVLPIATNLGLFGSCEDFVKEAGQATNQILEPIPAGLGTDEFMTRLENVLETASSRLCAEGQATHPNLSQAGVEWVTEMSEA
jgi:1-acyl-sn-glycerol-3-phosphate acyltransferase